MCQVIELPRDIRSAHNMRKAINERAMRVRASEGERIHAVCEGLDMMRADRSSAVAVQIGWQRLKESITRVSGFGGFAA
jgi:hypothetical protein